MMERLIKGILFSFLVLFASCSKVEYDCDYTITTYTQEKEEGEMFPKEGVKVFAYYANEAEWEVANYTDAQNGILTRIVPKDPDEPEEPVDPDVPEESRNGNGGRTEAEPTPEQRGPDFKLLSDVDGKCVFNITGDPIMFVVCNETLGWYAWRGAEIEKGLDLVNVFVNFEEWDKSRNRTMQGRWTIINPDPVIPPDPDPAPDPDPDPAPDPDPTPDPE